MKLWEINEYKSFIYLGFVDSIVYLIVLSVNFS